MSNIFWAAEFTLMVIVIMSGGIAWEFYKSRNGRLRQLIIALFVCKVWVYGGAGMFFIFWEPDANSVLRMLILNIPMMAVMLYLWKYIRMHNKF